MFHFETQPAPQEKIQDSPAEKEGGARVGTTRGNSTVIQISGSPYSRKVWLGILVT